MIRKVIEKLVTVRDTILALFRYQLLRLRCSAGNGPKAESGDRHLLILAWLFPPMVTGGVYRPLSFARYAAERGWRVTVLAGPSPSVTSEAGRYLSDQLPASVRVVRVSTPKRSLSYRFFPHLDGGFDNVIASLETALSLDDLAPSVVLASGPPFHNFVVAWHLSRYFQAPLVLDYRDEWTQCPFDFVHAGDFDVDWEHRCLERARSVIVTTRSFAEHAAKTFPHIDPGKYLLVPNGFDPADLPEVSSSRHLPVAGVPIEIAFLGYLGSHTPPDSFISTLLKALELRPDLAGRVRLRFVGEIATAIHTRLQDDALASLVQLTSQVPKPEALQIMRESAALLILNPTALNRYIPGKLFDYLASNTPILVYGEDGEAANIVRELEAGQIVPKEDPRALADAIDRITAFPVMLDLGRREAWLASHHRKKLANTLLDHLESL